MYSVVSVCIAHIYRNTLCQPERIIYNNIISFFRSYLYVNMLYVYIIIIIIINVNDY